MSRQWKCPRCSAPNDEAAVSCRVCGAIRGAVIPDIAAQPAPFHSNADAPPAMLAAPPTAEADNTPAEPDAVASTKPNRLRPLTLALGGLVAIFMAVGVVAGGLRTAQGELASGSNVSASSLKVGDCFDLTSPASEEVDDVIGRPCTVEHEYELFYVVELPPGDYPGEDSFGPTVDSTCLDEFESYVGRSYEDSELDVFWLYPSSEAWATGDRTIQCAAHHPDVHLVESVKGSMQ